MTADPLRDDWHAVARSADLPDGGPPAAARLLGDDLVLWRTGGVACAWRDLCVHRGSRLSLGRVEGGCLVCPYHGWAYAADGRCARIPAQPDRPPPEAARAQALRVAEASGWVWASPGDPPRPPVAVPEFADPAYRVVPCGPYRVRASAPRVVENFLDVAHLPVVHAGLLGDPAHAAVRPYEVDAGPDGLTARDITLWQPDPDGTGVGRDVRYTYRVPRPLVAGLAKEGAERFVLWLAVTPADERESVMWMTIAMNYAHAVPAADLRAFQDRVVAQDVPVVESQRPELLPLDLAAELHLVSDRTGVAYRRWLRQLGVRFGTA